MVAKKESKSRCGQVFASQKLMKMHQPKCQTCRSLAWKGKVWVSRCLMEFRTYPQMQDHQRECEECRRLSRENIKARNVLLQKESTSRCGQVFASKTAMNQHQRSCRECRNLGWGGKTWVSRCGLDFQTWSRMNEHHKSCEECRDIKRKNIKARNLKTNRSEGHRKAASTTARNTSMRPEIQAQRAERLKKWREANPEKFKECTLAAQKSPKRSKMEAWLRKELGWKTKKIRCGERAEQKWKQVDMVKGKVWIEVDGFYHFFEHPTNTVSEDFRLPTVQQRDDMLNKECLRRKDVALIRVDMSCFHSSTGRMGLEWWALFQSMLRSPMPGVWCLGKLYEQCPWADTSVTILRSPVPPTTSSSPTG